METRQKKLATLHRVVLQVEFSLLLAFLGPLEALRSEKCAEYRCNTLQHRKQCIFATELFHRNPHKCLTFIAR